MNVFADLDGIDLDWMGLQRLIQVERIGIRSGKLYQQSNYYISSLITRAITFAEGIRERVRWTGSPACSNSRKHWGIENRLHWVKDVVFSEDAAPFSNYNAATN